MLNIANANTISEVLGFNLESVHRVGPRLIIYYGLNWERIYSELCEIYLTDFDVNIL